MKGLQTIAALFSLIVGLHMPIGILGTASAQPKVCTGYLPNVQRWGNRVLNDQLLCPAHYAFFGTAKPVGEDGAATALVSGVCCPLPAEDILTNEESFQLASCPIDSVATGVRQQESEDSLSNDSARRFELRCTKINTDRYQLSAPKMGALWGFDLSSGPYFWKEDITLKASDLPPAIRTGLERHDYQEFSQNGCVGMPFGSLLVAKTGKRCKNFLYRQLQFKGELGDPPSGTPVPMFPTCRYISDPFSPTAECIE